MREATITDLKKQWNQVQGWIEAGESVRILRRGVVVAELHPPGGAKAVPPPAPADDAKPDSVGRVEDLDALLQNPMLSEDEVALMTGSQPRKESGT